MASGPPSLFPTPEDLTAGFSRRPETLSFYRFPASELPPLLLRPRPWRLHPRWCLCWPLHPLVFIPHRFPPIPLLLPSASFQPPPPAVVLASSYDVNSSVFYLIHSALSAKLSPVPVPPSLYFPPAPSLCLPSSRSYIFIPIWISVDAVIYITSVVPLATPTVLRFAPLPSLDIPHFPLPPYLPSLTLLRLPAPPLAPPPPDLAADIARKDEYAGDRTVGGEACWSTPGGSAPH